MNDLKKITLPPIIPKINIPEQQVEEKQPESLLYQFDGIEFDYSGGRLLMNRQEISRLISDNLTHFPASYWSNVAYHLENYRKFVMKRIQEPDQLAIFSALVQTLLHKLSGRLKRKLDETVDALTFSVEDGQLLLNGINVNAFLEMAKQNPTQKAKIFLKGLKNRLGIMLTNRLGNPNYEKIRSIAHDLFDQIDQELGKPPPGIILLPPPKG